MQETGGNDAAPVTVGYPYLENWNESYERNPIGLLIEITNSQKWRTLFTQCMQVVKDGKTLFCTSVVVNGRKFPDCYSPQKKQAKKDACLLAMRLSYLKTRSLIDSLNPAQQIDLARTMNLTPDDVTMAESLNQMYQENGTEDAYGVSSLPGTRPPEGGAFIHGGGDYPQGGYDYGQNTDFYSFEGQSFDNNGDGIKSGNGEGPDFPIPQYGVRPPQVYTGQKRRLAPGETVVAQKKVKKNPGPKSPVSAVLEYGQKTSQEVKFEVVSEGGQPHRPMIVMNVVLGDKTFPSVEARGKKAGRTAAALACLRQLAEEGTFVDPAVDLWPVEPEVKVETEIKPATEEPGPPEVISGSLPPVKAGEKVKGLTTESFALIHKHPITALMEYGQQRRVPAKIETVEERGPSHDSVFVLAAVIGDRTFPSVECKKKKFGRLLAADKALRILVSEGEYISQLTTGPAELATITEDMTHFDKMAALSHQTFNSLIAELNQSVPGRKVLAAIIVKQSDDDLGTVVSIGSGNRCVSGDQLSMEGTTVNDSHAEVVARRSFLRYLYKKLQGYDPKADDQLFEGGPQGKLRVKEGVTFHMYISTAPCGDGALFSPRDTSFKIQPPDADIESREHKPLFTSEVQGLLRTKVEGGEGTIPVETDLIPQTWDGLQRGERLRTMSCTDKICRWNVTGIQGALLSHFIEPIYLESVTIGFLYDHGHLARALCCRLTQGDTPIQGLLPTGYRLNHPWLGRVTICKPPRDTYKTRSQSLNWCLGDTVSEVTDGTLGMIKQKPEDEAPKFSRLCKRQMFEQFKALCFKFRKEKLLDTENYAKCKLQAEDYQVAKQQLCTVLQKNKYGTWVSKPIEEELFSL